MPDVSVKTVVIGVLIEQDVNSEKKIRVVTWSLALYFFLTPFDFFPIIPGASLIRFVALFPLFALLFYVNSMKIYADRYFFLPVVYTGFLVLTSMYSVSFSDSQVRVISTATNIALILLLAMIDYRRHEIQLLRKAIIYSGWLTAILLLHASRGLTAERLTIAIGRDAEDPNYLVGYLMFVLIHYLERYLSQKKLRYLTFTAVFIAFIFMTGSRGGLLAVIGASLFFIFLWMRRQNLKLSVIFKSVFMAGILALTIYFVFFNLPIELRDRFTLFDEIIEEGGSGRTRIWANVIESFNNGSFINKLFGMGVATTTMFTDGRVAHNIWLDALLETGIIGTAILFLFYFEFIKKVYKLKDHIVTSVFFGYMLMALSMSLDRYRPIWNILLFILIIKNFENSKSYVSTIPIGSTKYKEEANGVAVRGDLIL